MKEKKWPLRVRVKVKNIRILIMNIQEYTRTIFCDKKIPRYFANFMP